MTSIGEAGQDRRAVSSVNSLPNHGTLYLHSPGERRRDCPHWWIGAGGTPSGWWPCREIEGLQDREVTVGLPFFYGGGGYPPVGICRGFPPLPFTPCLFQGHRPIRCPAGGPYGDGFSTGGKSRCWRSRSLTVSIIGSGPFFTAVIWPRWKKSLWRSKPDGLDNRYPLFTTFVTAAAGLIMMSL